VKGGDIPASYKPKIEKAGDINEYDDITINHTEKRSFSFDFTPVIASVPVQNISEDSEALLNISGFISDPDHDLEELQVTLCHGSEANTNVSLSDKTFHFKYSLPEATDVVFFSVNDGIRNATSSFIVHAAPVNDPPIYFGPESIPLIEDENYTLPLNQYISDEDNPLSSLTISIKGDYARLDGFKLIICYPDGVLGGNVEINISDPLGATCNVLIEIYITAVNDPPIITQMPEIMPVEDIELAVDFSSRIQDPDSFPESLVLSTNSSYCKVEGLKLKFLYPEGVTRESVRITVSDGKDSTFYDLNIIVRPVNDPPFLKSLPFIISVIAGESHTVNLGDLIDDTDTPKEKLSISQSSPYVKVRGFNITITFPKGTPSGTEYIELRLFDGIDGNTTKIPVNVTAAKVEQQFIVQYAVYIYILVPAAIIGTAAGILVYRRIKYGWYEVKRAFIVYQDGRMLAHYGEGAEKEDQLLISSMLTAVQQFIEEVMKNEKAGSLKEFQYEDLKIAVERGNRIYLAVFLNGYATDKLRNEMKEIVSDIEQKYDRKLADWDGRITQLDFVDAAVARLRILAEKK